VFFPGLFYRTRTNTVSMVLANGDGMGKGIEVCGGAKWHEDHGKDEPVGVYPLYVCDVCVVEREPSPLIPKKDSLPFDTPVPQLGEPDPKT